LGETALLAGPRVGKDMPRIEVCGTIDELNAVIGLARAESMDAEANLVLARVQNELLSIGTEVASPDPVAKGYRWIGPDHVRALEADIDHYEQALSPPAEFILPAGTRTAAALHLARTVCRRAERRLVTLVRRSEEPISVVLMAYLNRLSDLLFVLARHENARAGRADIVWQKPGHEEASEA